ncbi:hypothetical protein GCM10017778_56260 [Streptomyces vinaceus]|nr:hypothetical protein GCM10017778_56260 [Streptomyces vinaceus]
MQVRAGVGVQAQGAGEGVEQLGRRVAFTSLFQARVVVRVHAGQNRDLFPAQSGDPSYAVVGHADVSGAQTRSAGAEEFSQLVVGHVVRLAPATRCYLGAVHPGSAEAIAYAVSQPARVDVNEIVVRPAASAR